MDIKPVITRRFRGEYSTVMLPNGVIETMFFPNDGSGAVCVDRSNSLERTARAHIERYESENGRQ